MAKEAKAEVENAEGGTPPKKSMKLLVIVAAALVLLLAVGGGAAYFLMKGHGDQEGDDGEVATENAKADKKKGKEAAPVYIALEPFTVNLVPENGDQFLQLIISFEVADLHTGDRVKSYTPKLRNNIMMLLSGKKASELIAKEGKVTLAAEIRDLVNDILDPGGKANSEDAPVKEVLFTSFIIQ